MRRQQRADDPQRDEAMKASLKKRSILFSAAVLLAAIVLIGCKQMIFSSSPAEPVVSTAPVSVEPARPRKPKYVRGIHVTAWGAGSTATRARLDKLFTETELNTIVIAIKEQEGEVYIPGVRQAQKTGTFVNAIPGVEKYIAGLKEKGIYTIARIVVFRDALLPRKQPALGVKTPEGALWQDHKGKTWLDPTNRDAWDYNIAIAERALELGFDEIQFDYIRFPSDGNTKTCRYSVRLTTTSANNALVGFLKTAHERLKPRGANISIDVFGLTTTVEHDMGIGQRIVDMAQWVDYVSPMVYPSHYNPGEYGIANPNAAPYQTVFRSMEGAVRRLGAEKVRPYLQDFSWGVRYSAKEVRDQIQATYDTNVGEWLLWNAANNYTLGALKDKSQMDIFEKSPVIPREGKSGFRTAVAISSATLQPATTEQR